MNIEHEKHESKSKEMYRTEPNRTEQEREGSEKTRFYISVIWLFFICTSVIAKVFAYFSKKKKIETQKTM